MDGKLELVATSLDELKFTCSKLETDCPQKAIQNLLKYSDYKLEQQTVANENSKSREKEVANVLKSIRENDRQLATLKKDLADETDKRNSLNYERERLAPSLTKLREDLERMTNEPAPDLTELQRDIYLYTSVLGLEFKQHQNGTLTVIYRHVFQNSPQSICSFDLVIENDAYSVENCQPNSIDINQLVKNLNATNNLKTFIFEMRKKFQSVGK